MSDRWTDSLSDYLDGGMESAERRLMEAHLAECAECAATVEDLRLVTSHARSLPSEAPTADLWPGIQARIRSAPAADRAAVIAPRGGFPARRFSFSLPQLAAACAALAVLSGGAVWYAMSQAPSRVPGILAGGIGAPANSLAAAAGPDHAAVQDVEALRIILESGREKLDPATVRSLEESLMIIDLAIRQARRALGADPNNPYVKAHLDDTMRRKVEFLRRATMLASAPQ